MHEPCPTDGCCCPAGQFVHAVAAAPEYWPAAQFSQTFEPSGLPRHTGNPRWLLPKDPALLKCMLALPWLHGYPEPPQWPTKHPGTWLLQLPTLLLYQFLPSVAAAASQSACVIKCAPAEHCVDSGEAYTSASGEKTM